MFVPRGKAAEEGASRLSKEGVCHVWVVKLAALVMDGRDSCGMQWIRDATRSGWGRFEGRSRAFSMSHGAFGWDVFVNSTL